MASSLESACSLVYSWISPPTIFLNTAKISFPIFFALTVLPLAIPSISEISFSGILSIVEIINEYEKLFESYKK